MRIRCPECVELAHAEARVCPHCGTHFSADQLRTRYRVAQLRGVMLILIAAAILWALTAH